MKKYIQAFLLMVQFVTRIPIKMSLPCEKEDFKRGIVFFPLIGFIIGIAQWIIYFVLHKIMPINLLSVIIALDGFIITGGFHLDGFSDMCDGFFSSRGKERIIEIMKDSRVGTFGALALISDFIIKIYAIQNVSSLNTSLVIIMSPIIARTFTVWIMYIGKPAKNSGIGNLTINNIDLNGCIISTIISLAIVICLAINSISILKVVVMYMTAFLGMFILNRLSNNKIDGITGDILGACTEIGEMLVLIVGSMYI
jgi:adenosylcobinamide-GDP ribazoletransferase